MRGLSSRGVWDQLGGLLVFGAAGQLGDEELLGRFVARRDAAAEAAFATLVKRYGPMVLGVCRRVLGNRDEAEDAFQATFLVLARKAGSIARPDQLANWLFGVACRIALDARTSARRRKARERRLQVASLTQIAPAGDEQPVLDELRAVLDEELARLPEHYRGAVVLCELQGLTRSAAARRLGIPEGTLSSRIARAKGLLRGRLARRGLALSALALHRGLAREAQARAFTAPLSLVDSTVRAATRVAAGAPLAEAASTAIATLAQGVLKAMLLAHSKGIVLGLAALAVVTAGAGILAQTPSHVRAVEIQQGSGASVAVAQRPSPNMKRLVLPGTTALEPTKLVRMRARFAPARVVEVGRVWVFAPSSKRPEHRELTAGDKVKKGDLLAVLYSADVVSKRDELLDDLVQLELDQRILDHIEKNRQAVPDVYYLTQLRTVQGDRTEVARALENLKMWDIPQEEIEALFAEAKKLSADKDAWLKTPEAQWVRRDGQTKGAEARRHKEARSPWGLISLRAPIDGVIVERSLHLDEMVVDNTINLFQIADLSRLLVLANCPEDSLASLEVLRGNERRWTVRASGADLSAGIEGSIEEIDYAIDPVQHTAVIKGHIENPGGQIRLGQYVKVTVNVPLPDDVVEIPVDALLEDGKQSLVFVMSDNAGHEYTKRRVKVIERLEHKVLVRTTPIPKEEQPTAAEAEQRLLPIEPLTVGERVSLDPVTLQSLSASSPGQRVRLDGAAESVGTRLSAVERKLDQILEALQALTQRAAPR
jgi:membrane fusion protein, heavy metal efflux system